MILAGNHCYDTSRQHYNSSAASYDTRLLPKVSLHRGPSIVSSGEMPAFHKGHGALLPRSPEPYPCSLHCRAVQVLEGLQNLFPTVHFKGRARALIGDAGHNPHAHSSDVLIGLAQPILPSGLRCQRILPSLFSLFNSPNPLPPSPPLPLSPAPSSSCFNQ